MRYSLDQRFPCTLRRLRNPLKMSAIPMHPISYDFDLHKGLRVCYYSYISFRASPKATRYLYGGGISKPKKEAYKCTLKK